MALLITLQSFFDSLTEYIDTFLLKFHFFLQEKDAVGG